MSLIFLDFDGVLNRCSLEGYMISRTESMLEPELVQRVAKLVDLTGAKVVCSTTWREWHSLKVLRGLLQDHGLDGRHVVGVTPDLRFKTRGEEIAAYLNGRSVRFAVLDDNDTDRFDMDPVRAHFVQTYPVQGLMWRDVKRAQALLTTGPIWTPALQLIAV